MEPKSGEAEEEAGLVICWGRRFRGEVVCGVGTPVQGSLGGGGASCLGVWCGGRGLYIGDGNGPFHSDAGLLGGAQLARCSFVCNWAV